jgi:hypothetical protein
MVLKASMLAKPRFSAVRASTDRKYCLTFDHPGSMGDKSGEYGGSGKVRAPADCTACSKSAA